ncbi:phage shock protein, partial [Mytilinidion resinicola]
MARTVLVDVRMPGEYVTGFLGSAINIEYQDISQLAQRASKTDEITLYCRSGRRSGIARETLKSLGFENVRDIGGLEEARETLRKEEIQR